MTKKLSEIVLKMIEPYRGNDISDEILVSIAMCSWNMTIVPQKDAEETRKSMLSISADEEQRQTLQVLNDKFTQYKLENYKDDKRFIVNFQFDTAVPPNLHIISTRIGVGDSELNDSSRKLKVERNAPCPCGSGKKYKRCCGKN